MQEMRSPTCPHTTEARQQKKISLQDRQVSLINRLGSCSLTAPPATGVSFSCESRATSQARHIIIKFCLSKAECTKPGPRDAVIYCICGLSGPRPRWRIATQAQGMGIAIREYKLIYTDGERGAFSYAHQDRQCSSVSQHQSSFDSEILG